MAAGTIMVGENHVESVEKTKVPLSKQYGQKFLDYFYQLADEDANVRKRASVDLIQNVLAPFSPESKLSYTVGRLVQGLASTRQKARHGFYIALVGLLTTVSPSRLTNQHIYDVIGKHLIPKGSKTEKVDQYIAQVLAYGALLKSGRVLEKNEVGKVIEHILTNAKQRNYIQQIGYSFITEAIDSIDPDVFKNAVWPALQNELKMSWEDHNFDTFNLLLSVRIQFPKCVKADFFRDNLGVQKIGEASCFQQLAAFLLKNSVHHDHPVLNQTLKCLHNDGSLLDFWSDALDSKLVSLSKSKITTVLNLLKHALQLVSDEEIEKVLTENVMACLISLTTAKEEPSNCVAVEILGTLKSRLILESIAGETQAKIVEHFIKSSGHVIFDKNTDTKFMAEINPFLKKETVYCLSDLYRSVVSENGRLQDRSAAAQLLAKLVSHPAVQRGEVEWKAAQLSFLAEWAYFNKAASKSLSGSVREAFYRALDSPCKKLDDLAGVLLLTIDQLKCLVMSSDLGDEIKSTWKNLLDGFVKKMRGKQSSVTKSANLWVDQVFLVLLLNMALQMFKEPKLASGIIDELIACYAKAIEKKKKTNTGDKDEPHWLEVVTDILLSLLSQNQHLLRSIVLSVWSALASRLTPTAVQQVLDVIDPTKTEAPLMNVDDESSDVESEDDEEEAKSDEEPENEDEGDSDEMVDDEEPETVTDKLRAKIHEALGDGAALTDTESVDIDELSDGEMKSLDTALSAAFREFRKARPVRKNANKLPKDVTTLMHFRLRCLDLIEVLSSTDKEVHINLVVPTLLPLLSLLESTVKEPLQKPLMDRTRAVLRKVAGMRRFVGANDPAIMDSLVKSLQILFSKCNSKKLFMPFIGEDLALCCTFILRCALHLSPPASSVELKKIPEDKESRVQMEEMYQMYHTNLSRFFRKRDSPIPSSIFSRALQYPWPDGGFLLESLITYALGSDGSVIKSRKLQAMNFLTLLFRNTTALSALGEQQLRRQLVNFLQNVQRVLNEATANDTKPRFISDLFALSALVFQCSCGSKAVITSNEELTQHWNDTKTAVTQFIGKRIVREREIRKGYLPLARALNLPTHIGSVVKDVASASVNKIKEQPSLQETQTPTEGNENTTKTTDTLSSIGKKTKKKSAPNQERKEAKKRRMKVGAEGIAEIAFTDVNIDDVVDTEVGLINAAEEASKTGRKKIKEREKTSAQGADSTKHNGGVDNLESDQDSAIKMKSQQSSKQGKKLGHVDIGNNVSVDSPCANGATKATKKRKKVDDRVNGDSQDVSSQPAEERGGSLEPNNQQPKTKRKKKGVASDQ